MNEEKIIYDFNQIVRKKFDYCKSNKICKVDNCNNPVFCKGYCTRHYAQIQHHGKIIDTIFDKNKVILHDDFAEIIVTDKYLNYKASCIIDLEDVEKVIKYKVGILSNGYFTLRQGRTICYRLHRFLLNVHTEDTKNNVVDHIDRNKCNNRKSNLRLTTSSENNRNMEKFKNVKFTHINKYPNTTYIKDRNHWVGVFIYKGKQYYCGSYSTEFEAYNAVITKKQQLGIL